MDCRYKFITHISATHFASRELLFCPCHLNLQDIYILKGKSIYYLTVSRVQEIKCGFVGWLWLHAFFFWLFSKAVSPMLHWGWACGNMPLTHLTLLKHICSVTQSCPTLWYPMDFRLPSSSVHEIFQARILKWVTIFSSRGSSQSRDGTCVSITFCIGRWILYHLATWEAPTLIYVVVVVQSLSLVWFLVTLWAAIC